MGHLGAVLEFGICWEIFQNVTLGSMLAAAMMSPTDAFFNTIARFWELAAGVVLAIGEAGCGQKFQDLRRSAGAQVALQMAAGVLLLLALALTPETDGFPFPWALLSIGCAACVVAGEPDGSHLNRYLARDWMVYVGQLSYVIYLWHWPWLVCYDLILIKADTFQRFRSVACAFVFATLTHHGLEIPSRRWWPARSWQIFAVAALIALASEVWIGQLGGPLRGHFYAVGSSPRPAYTRPSPRARARASRVSAAREQLLSAREQLLRRRPCDVSLRRRREHQAPSPAVLGGCSD